jgi:hypothetical protein
MHRTFATALAARLPFLMMWTAPPAHLAAPTCFTYSECMSQIVTRYPRREPRFLWLFLGKVILLAMTIVVVWAVYAYLHAYRLDWLGWIYVKLQPLTNGLYALVDAYLPDDVKYKIRGAISDDLGQRSLFLLLLTATVELTLYSAFKFVKYLVVGPR